MALIEFGPASNKVILGGICIALAAACYAGSLVLLGQNAVVRLQHCRLFNLEWSAAFGRQLS